MVKIKEDYIDNHDYGSLGNSRYCEGEYVNLKVIDNNVDTFSQTIKVKTPNGKKVYFCPEELELMGCGFQVGDRVMCLDTDPNDPTNEIGTIVEIDDDDYLKYLVHFDSWTEGHNRGNPELKESAWYCENLELVPKFKAGDTVLYDGEQRQVKAVPGDYEYDRHDFAVVDEGVLLYDKGDKTARGRWTFQEKCELLTNEDQPNVSTFDVGDIIKDNGTAHYTYTCGDAEMVVVSNDPGKFEDFKYDGFIDEEDDILVRIISPTEHNDLYPVNSKYFKKVR